MWLLLFFFHPPISCIVSIDHHHIHIEVLKYTPPYWTISTHVSLVLEFFSSTNSQFFTKIQYFSFTKLNKNKMLFKENPSFFFEIFKYFWKLYNCCGRYQGTYKKLKHIHLASFSSKKKISFKGWNNASSHPRIRRIFN